MVDKTKKAEQFLQEAYATDDDSSQLEFYKKWAGEYDKQMQQGLHYLAPEKISKALARFLQNSNAAIIDIGCGTGLTAQAVTDLGFITIDGLDYSPEMVEIARQKGIYRELFVADLNQPLQFADQSYTSIICSGTFTHGHVGAEPLDELIRILKPGGFLACTIHRDLWQKRGFAHKFNALESALRLTELERVADRYFEGAEKDGWFCVYQKG